MTGRAGDKAPAAAAAAIIAVLLAASGARAEPALRIVGAFTSPRATVARVPAPPSVGACLRRLHFRCYGPRQLLAAYDMAPLRRRGIDGRGRTIVLVDAFGSPTIRSDLRTFDRALGLPDPPSFRVYQPVGRVPQFDPRSFDRDGWAGETTLDVEWSHAFAPGANIVLLETPSDETEGLQGLPQLLAAERWALQRNIGDVMSMSFGATERTLPRSGVDRLRRVFAEATRRGVGLISATGDTGAAQPTRDNRALFTVRATEWPSTDPLVLAAGGTDVTLSPSGSRLRPDTVWHERGGASGGGVSGLFARPTYQAGEAGTVHGRRGVPDLSMSASFAGSELAYWSFYRRRPTWALLGGTSAATVELAGVVADADQLAGRSLANLPARVYALGAGSGIVDITRGNNSFGPFVNPDHHIYFVPGFSAGPGYDLASGLGTLDAARFVPALAAAPAG